MQDKPRQPRQDNIRQGTAIQYNIIQDKALQDKRRQTRQYHIRQDKAMQYNIRHEYYKTNQNTNIEDKTTEDKTSQDNTRR